MPSGVWALFDIAHVRLGQRVVDARVGDDPRAAGQLAHIGLKDRQRDSIVIATKVAGPGGGWCVPPVRNDLS
jgi:hypothetical protein